MIGISTPKSKRRTSLLIKLTLKDGRKILVNPNQIVCIAIAENSQSVIETVNGANENAHLWVNESFDQILDVIDSQTYVYENE